MEAWHNFTVFRWKSHRDVKFSREFSACIKQKTKPYVYHGCYFPYFYIIWSGTILIYSNSLVCDTILQGPQNEIWGSCELHKQPTFLGAAEDLCWSACSAAVSLPWCSGQLSCWPKHPWSLLMPQGFRKKELREIGSFLLMLTLHWVCYKSASSKSALI